MISMNVVKLINTCQSFVDVDLGMRMCNFVFYCTMQLWGFVYPSKYEEMLTLCCTEKPGICRFWATGSLCVMSVQLLVGVAITLVCKTLEGVTGKWELVLSSDFNQVCNFCNFFVMPDLLSWCHHYYRVTVCKCPVKFFINMGLIHRNTCAKEMFAKCSKD
jgi:hypothetical protein